MNTNEKTQINTEEKHINVGNDTSVLNNEEYIKKLETIISISNEEEKSQEYNKIVNTFGYKIEDEIVKNPDINYWQKLLMNSPNELKEIINESIKEEKEYDRKILNVVNGGSFDDIKYQIENAGDIRLNRIFKTNPEIQGAIQKHLESLDIKKLDLIETQTKNKVLKNEIRKILEKQIAPFGLSLGMFDNARYNSIGFDLERVIESMKVIEKKHSGGVKTLNAVFGIINFQRYSPEVLINQIDHITDDVPYSIVLSPQGDRNGAFTDLDKSKTTTGNFIELIEDIYKQSKEKHLYRFIESSSRVDLARKFLTMDKMYGNKNKISSMIVAAHGQHESFELFGDDSQSSKIDTQIIQGNDIKRFFVSKPEVLMISCNTGNENGIAQQLSKSLDAKVIAPTDDIFSQKLKINLDNKNPSYDIDYAGITKNEYVSGNLLK